MEFVGPVAKALKKDNGKVFPGIRWEHQEQVKLPIRLLYYNGWNPNEMTESEFNALSGNVDEVAMLDPVLVVPWTTTEQQVEIEDRLYTADHGQVVTDCGEVVFRVVDGEHRTEQQRIADAEYIPCIIGHPERLDEFMQKKQTMRMNMIRGKLNRKKFNALVEDFINNYGTDMDALPDELGFSDSKEFYRMIDVARESLPEDLQKEFDRVKDGITNIDDLGAVINRLFSEFGDTVPANYMILDFGGKDHIWVKISVGKFDTMRRVADDIRKHGHTFDSMICHILEHLNIEKYVERYGGQLELIESHPQTFADEED